MALPTRTPLDQFAEMLDTLVPQFPAAEIVERVHSHFAELIADTGWLDDKFRAPPEAGDMAAYLLAAGERAPWTIVSVVFPPGTTTPVHDHLTWGMVGVVQGTETETRFARLDDGARPGFARLRRLEAVQNDVGAISHVVPPDREIHRIHNPSGEPSCSIHLYGEDLQKLARHEFDLDSGEVRTHQPAYEPTKC
ncbi:MAG TPA: cysteine dioxygenase family protein [Actinophytocola sp.]|jgi:predicted metal-dependent enzyme (double-stranded beta helix superfamily)|nr:cysteine dioxygenase family protein [Actinophytocola sp.]